MKKLVNGAFFGNTGHFDNNIGLAGSKGLEYRKSRQRCVEFVFLVGHGLFVLASGRLWELICVAIRPSRCRIPLRTRCWRSLIS